MVDLGKRVRPLDFGEVRSLEKDNPTETFRRTYGKLSRVIETQSDLIDILKRLGAGDRQRIGELEEELRKVERSRIDLNKLLYYKELVYEKGWTQTQIRNMGTILQILSEMKGEGEISEEDYRDCFGYLSERREEYLDYDRTITKEMGKLLVEGETPESSE